MKLTLKNLCAVTDGCREDMAEPDEQGLKAWVVGTVLDSSHGDDISAVRLRMGCQELVVCLERGPSTECFNLATLIALARKAAL